MKADFFEVQGIYDGHLQCWLGSSYTPGLILFKQCIPLLGEMSSSKMRLFILVGRQSGWLTKRSAGWRLGFGSVCATYPCFGVPSIPRRCTAVRWHGDLVSSGLIRFIQSVVAKSVVASWGSWVQSTVVLGCAFAAATALALLLRRTHNAQIISGRFPTLLFSFLSIDQTGTG